MKILNFFAGATILAGVMTACDSDIEAEQITHPLVYDSQYYQNLRDYKESEHSIAFGWFAGYGTQHSGGVRFLNLPDSLDIVSLWGGIPAKEETQIWEEIRFVQQVKGTRMLVVAITSFDREEETLEFRKVYDESQKLPEGSDERTAMENKAMEMYAEYFLDQVFENDLDGFDIDYEPSNDIMSNEKRAPHFILHMAKYLGPNPYQTKEERLKLIEERYGKEVASRPGVCDKMLCIDQPNAVFADYKKYIDYYFFQTYSGDAHEGELKICLGWPEEKVVYCTNMGGGWKGKMEAMYEQAAYQPANGKRKGGFGTFYIHRDYTIHENNPEPYYRFRQCIQIQNPAIR
jgi:hypothetical protein